MQQSSRFALSRGRFDETVTHPDDETLDVQTFDPIGEFPFKYAYRRKKYSELEGMTP
jgi:hypothetical protein